MISCCSFINVNNSENLGQEISYTLNSSQALLNSGNSINSINKVMKSVCCGVSWPQTPMAVGSNPSAAVDCLP